VNVKSALRLLPYSIIALALTVAIGNDFGGGFQKASAQASGTPPPSIQQTSGQAGQSAQRSSDPRRGPGGPGPCGSGPGGPGSLSQWWVSDDIKKELGLTPAQVAQEQKLWDDARPILSSLNDERVKQEKELDRLVDERKVDASVIALHLDYVEGPRTQGFKTRMVMLYRMSQVLTADQNKKLQEIWLRNCGGGRGRHDGPHYPN
jgi:Spy/CpxP family protein refolding chaperone